MPPQSLISRKRRIVDESVLPVRRRRVQHCLGNNQAQTIRENGNGKHGNQREKRKPSTFLLSSPTDVSDAAVVKQIRTKQATTRGLPNLSLSPLEKPIVAKVGQAAKDEEASELEEEAGVGSLTPRPAIPRRTATRPPLGRRRAAGLNRARFGVGIVRCRTWIVNDEGTETEDESPESWPLREDVEGAGCGYSEYDDSEKLEAQVTASVLPIDPTLACFDRSFSEDQWQLRSPSPDEKFVPENSCCVATNVEKTVDEECGSKLCKPTPIHAAYVEGN